MLGVFWRKWKAFLKYSFGEQLLVPVVFVLLALARLIILLIPFRHYSRLLGEYAKTDMYTPILSTAQIDKARRLGRVVRVTATITPWDSLCLVQALVACLLLRLTNIPYIMHFGLERNKGFSGDKPMNAHAWVVTGAVAVTGGRSLPTFTVVGSYVSPQLVNKLMS